jgi:hypothetical protein
MKKKNEKNITKVNGKEFKKGQGIIDFEKIDQEIEIHLEALSDLLIKNLTLPVNSNKKGLRKIKSGRGYSGISILSEPRFPGIGLHWLLSYSISPKKPERDLEFADLKEREEKEHFIDSVIQIAKQFKRKI